MNCRNNFQAIWLGIWLSLSFSYFGFSQNSSFEFWPETDIWYRINPSWRLSSFIALTKYHESDQRDLNFSLQADYAWGKPEYTVFRKLMDDIKVQQMKAFLIRGGLMEGWSLGEYAGIYTEDMLFVEIHKRQPLLIFGEILFSQRLRTDLRWVGQDPEFSYRFRYRAMVEKEFTDGSFSLIPYVSTELFWDSRYLTISRVRAIGGATVSWGPSFAFEGNITYQYDSHYNTQNLYALNLILHVFFE